jgi:hypothetical protein
VSSSILANPVLEVPPPNVSSCVHCRTVTWAGVPACDCEFGRLAVDESAVRELYSDEWKLND